MTVMKFSVPPCYFENDIRYSSSKGIHVWDRTDAKDETQVGETSKMKCVLCGMELTLIVDKASPIPARRT